MKIRLASAGDAPAIADLWNVMIRDTLATFTTELKTTQHITDLMTLRTGAFWLAETDHVVGFATFGPFRTGPGYAATVEHTVILSPAAQGQGIANALMDTVEAAAKAQDKHIMVAAISSANPRAVAFHTKRGYQQTARLPQVGRKADQWLDLILMQKTISTH